MGRVSCEHERQYYAKRRLAKLRTVCPDLPDDVMERVGLRQLSYSVRRAGKLVGKLQRSETREGVRSITEKVRPECGQRVYQATLVGSDPIKGTLGVKWGQTFFYFTIKLKLGEWKHLCSS